MSVFVSIDETPRKTHGVVPAAQPVFTHRRNIYLIAEVLEIKRRMAQIDEPEFVRRVG